MEVNDSALAFDGASPSARLIAEGAFDAFLEFSRQPADYTGGSTEGSLIWVEFSATDPAASAEAHDVAGAALQVLFSRDIPALDADGMYVGRWSAGLALLFAKDVAKDLPQEFHLEASLEDPYQTGDEPSAEPTTVDEFAEAFRAAVPQFFGLQAESITVSRLQQVD